MKISPSILSCDFTKIEEVINKLKENSCQYLHLDVMDGNFVPRITFGAKYIDDLEKYKGNLIFDTHLMVSDPLIVINEFIKSSDYITIHIESKNVNETLEIIKKNNKKAGISIKPNTEVSKITQFLDKVDMVLVMSVEPGLGGQTFMENSLEKIKTLKKIKEENSYNYLINIDGGINFDTAKLVKEAGADIVVSGTYIMNNIENFKKIESL